MARAAVGIVDWANAGVKFEVVRPEAFEARLEAMERSRSAEHAPRQRHSFPRPAPMPRKSLNLYGQTRNDRGRKSFGGTSIEAVNASRATPVPGEAGDDFTFNGSYPDLLNYVMSKAT
jgi:hypothetical protein